MKGSVTMRLRGYVTSNPKQPPEKPTLIEFPLIINKGYQDPVTGVTKDSVTYLCFAHLQNEQQANKMKFVKKGMFLSLKGSPNRPFVTSTKEGKNFVSIRVLIQDFDILTVIDDDEMTTDSRMSKFGDFGDFAEMDNIGNY